MGYKILGFLVWQGARLYLRRSFGGTKGKLLVAGLGVAIAGGVLVASRQASSSD